MDWWQICAIFALLLTLLCRISHKAMYIFKFIFMYISFGVISTVIILICLPRGRDIKNGIRASKIMKILTTLLGLSVTVEGEEHLRLDSGAVVMMNHQSSVDVLAMLEIWPCLERGVAVSKKSLLYTPFFGLGSWLIGTVFVDRAASTGRETIKKAGEEAKKTKMKLFLYPEGTRNTAKNLTLLPFKKGGFHVALDAELPIIPVVVQEYKFLDSKDMIFNPGEIIVRALPAIDTSGYTKETITDLIEVTRNKMLETLKEIDSVDSVHEKSE